MLADISARQIRLLNALCCLMMSLIPAASSYVPIVYCMYYLCITYWNIWCHHSYRGPRWNGRNFNHALNSFVVEARNQEGALQLCVLCKTLLAMDLGLSENTVVLSIGWVQNGHLSCCTQVSSGMVNLRLPTHSTLDNYVNESKEEINNLERKRKIGKE